MWPVIWIPGKNYLQIWIWKFQTLNLANWKFVETERFCPNHNLTFLLELDLLLKRRLSDLALLAGDTCTQLTWHVFSSFHFHFTYCEPQFKELCARLVLSQWITNSVAETWNNPVLLLITMASVRYDRKNKSSSFYRTQVYLGSDLWVRVFETHSQRFVKLIQVIQVIHVIDSIQRRWPFQVAPSGGQICN